MCGEIEKEIVREREREKKEEGGWDVRMGCLHGGDVRAPGRERREREFKFLTSNAIQWTRCESEIGPSIPI